MRITDNRATVLTFHIVPHHARLERAGPVERYQCDDLIETVRLQITDQIFDAARFELKHCGRFTVLQ